MLVTSECSAFSFFRISLIGERGKRGGKGGKNVSSLRALRVRFSLFSLELHPEHTPSLSLFPSLPHLKMGKSSSTMESTKA